MLLGPDGDGHGVGSRQSGSEGTTSEDFSLVAYYAGREAHAHADVPRNPLRAGLPVVATTRVGKCPEPDLVDFDGCDEGRRP